MPAAEFAENTTRVAVLGVGRWGLNIVRDLRSLGAEVIAVDPDPVAVGHAEALGAMGGGAELDGDAVDGIVIATPGSTHEHLLLALRHDVPIVCEKPLTVSAASARRVVDALGDRLTVLHVWRYHPGVEKTAWRDVGRRRPVAT